MNAEPTYAFEPDPANSQDAGAAAAAPSSTRVGYIACSASSRQLFELAQRVAASDCTVLIGGESGCGKEVLARYIHSHSPRASQPFVAVNCAAIPENMLEAMLFGYERGAFTGAAASHPGKFEQAQNGTLLLDEVTEMPLALQAKILRVLQEKEVERLGARTSIALNVRVLATTNRQLRTEVAAGRFREDLYYRLNVFPLTLTPLRARRDDVLPLAMQLLANHCRPGERIPALSATAGQKLLMHTWPGNVRELENVMQRALILVNGPVIEAHHIQIEGMGPEALSLSTAAGASTHVSSLKPQALSESVCDAERHAILEALRADQGNRRAMAQRLGISERTLRYKLAKLRDAGVGV